ncbi:MAG: DNA polymerase III subunit gamma/tau [Alistipes sp.]|nr:DNA polymerase III subunit gamma/tau [Alistipes sp.]
MENFIVSARKYRPATFASVVGQRHITSTLKNAIERGQLAHAYLFCGPRGVGKTTCARIFAKAINCLNPNGGEACNECESCRSFNEGRSLNVHELDAASNNSVDDIRNLIEQVRIIPQQGRYSVFVIDEVHMLTAAAFNAFLKTLEEPPHHAIFILATTEKHKIIPTILSRCQIYDFNRIRVEDGVEYLRYVASQEGITADDEALNLIAHKADGGMRDALSMFDKAVSFCGTTLNYKDVASTLNVLDYDTYFSVTELLLQGNYIDALLRFDEVLSRGFSPQVFVSGLNAHFRDLLMAQGPAITLVEFTGRLIERYKEQAARCDTQLLFNAISLLTDADGKIRQSSNQRLLVELGLMKIASLGQKKNDEVAFDTFDTSFALPDLIPATMQGAVQQGVVQQGAQAQQGYTPQPAPQQVQQGYTPQPAPQQVQRLSSEGTPRPTTEGVRTAVSIGAQPAANTAQQVASNTAQQPAANTAQQATPNTAQQSATSATQRPEGTGRATRAMGPLRSAVQSVSLTSMLAGDILTAGERLEQERQEQERTTSNIDPLCEEKISMARDKIIDSLMSTRPRLGRVFENMTVEGNVVKATVASQALCDEVMYEKSELQKLFATQSGATGLIEIEITVNERVKVARPITIEDRLRHLIAKNDRLTEMITALGLDAE